MAEEGERGAEEKSEEIKQAEESAERIFDGHKTGEERVEEIMAIIDPILESGVFDKEGIIKEIEACETATDKQEFIRMAVSAMAPLMELKKRNPEAFKKIATGKTLEQIEAEKFTEINEAFSYNEIQNEGGEKSFLIHLPITAEKRKRLGLAGIGNLFVDGLRNLAKITGANEEIKKIEANSTLVANRKGKAMKSLGFTVTGAISEELRRAHFPNEKDGAVWHAEVSREDFLKRYLGEDKE